MCAGLYGHPVFGIQYTATFMFRQRLDALRNGCFSDQQSFHQLLNALGKSGLEWWEIVRKEHFGGTTKLKNIKLFQQKKMRLNED